GPWVNVATGIRSLPVNGTFYAFHAQTGKLHWKSDLPNQALLLEQYKDLPILLFTSHSRQLVNGGMFQAMSTKSIAKRTGKLLYENQTRNQNGPQFHTLQVDMRTGTIDLIGYTMRLQHYLELNADESRK